MRTPSSVPTQAPLTSPPPTSRSCAFQTPASGRPAQPAGQWGSVPQALRPLPGKLTGLSFSRDMLCPRETCVPLLSASTAGHDPSARPRLSPSADGCPGVCGQRRRASAGSKVLREHGAPDASENFTSRSRPRHPHLPLNAAARVHFTPGGSSEHSGLGGRCHHSVPAARQRVSTRVSGKSTGSRADSPEGRRGTDVRTSRWPEAPAPSLPRLPVQLASLRVPLGRVCPARRRPTRDSPARGGGGFRPSRSHGCPRPVSSQLRTARGWEQRAHTCPTCSPAGAA